MLDGLNMDPNCKKSHLADKLDIVACTLEGEETSACWRQPSDDEEEYDGEVEDVDTEEDVPNDDNDDDEPFEMQLNDLDYDDHHFANHHSSPAPRQRRTDKHQQSQLQNKEWPLTWWPQLIPAVHHTVTVNDRERLLPSTDTRRRRPTRERNADSTTASLQHNTLASSASIDNQNSSPPSPLNHPTTQNDGGYWGALSTSYTSKFVPNIH